MTITALRTRLKQHLQDITGNTFFTLHGRVLSVTGTLIRASVSHVKIGEICLLLTQKNQLKAEVVGLDGQDALLAPYGELTGISANTAVTATGSPLQIALWPAMTGLILNGLGESLTPVTLPPDVSYGLLNNPPPSALNRKMITTPLSLGIRAIDGLLTCGEGQRMGIFAAAGGGKSTLLAAIIRNTQADICVLALVGERGRELNEFIEHDLGEEGLKKAVLVVSTSDRPAIERAKAGFTATRIAEYFRDRGKRVLLLMDSVTRFARAQREIGLAAGEPPARQGYPPSVFAQLPVLMERAGQSDKGSITALYTVLVEGDDLNEPVADETRSILDGHIVLTRKLAEMQHYPAIDVLKSASRVMNRIIPENQKKAAASIKTVLAQYDELEFLIQLGEYEPGKNPDNDNIIRRYHAIMHWLKQGTDESRDYAQTCREITESAL
ncbi:FliI/YscN family ATPase [Morganella psychrotolerans]|uniref:FliI/YscN family ATPase n=1 Tax=Morganella psychrotolerans TaxID=368603 RepID=UPI0039AF6227